MSDPAVAALGGWSTFYTMLGSSAAALIGLMFVVIGLVMGTAPRQAHRDGIAVFSTPTVVHLGAVLLTSAVVLAPWPFHRTPVALIALTGLAGLAYTGRLIARTRTLRVYQADLEDWLWYNILPLLGYGSLCVGGLFAFRFPGRALFVVAGGAVLLIFIAIRNAWDIVTYIATERREQQ